MTEPAPATAPPADWLSRAASALADDWRKLAGHCPGCGSPEPRLHPRDALGVKLCPDPFHGTAAAAPQPGADCSACPHPAADHYLPPGGSDHGCDHCECITYDKTDPAKPTTQTITPEETVFDFTPAKNALDRLEHVGEDVLSMAEKFAATQEGQDLLAAAHAILLAEDPALAATAAGVMAALAPKQAAAPAPAAPMVTNQG